MEDIGPEGQTKLRSSKVCLVGLGGLGTPTALQLTAMGVGRLRIIDRDIISRTDLHRQFLYDVSSIGYPKVEVGSKKLSSLNPDVKIEPIPNSLTAYNAEELLGDSDILVDGLDNASGRYIINRIAQKLKIPYVYGAAIESYGSTMTIIPGKTPCMACVFPNLSDENLPKCAVVGVLPPILSMVSSIMVSEVVRVLTGKEPILSGKMLYADLRLLTFDTVELSKNENCPVCSQGNSPIIEQDKHEGIEYSCGRDGKGVLVITPLRSLDIDLVALRNAIESAGLQVKRETDFSTAFEVDEKITINVLRTGNAIVEVKPPVPKGDVKKIIMSKFKEIVEDGLKLKQGSYFHPA